jgi:LysR family transcriptional regulator, regulator for bpeEF and oprC
MELFSELGVFTRVVELRSFTRAARALCLTPSGVSRSVTRLEERLGVRLLQRTTRSVSPTDDGLAYYARCSRILEALDEANLEMARAQRVPRGRLRVDAPQLLGQFILGPALPGFLAAWPELSVDVTFRDHRIDPVAEGVDVVLRLGELTDSELVARRLGRVRTVVVGAPSYFKRRRTPRTPAELSEHECVTYLADGGSLPWRFREGARVVPGRLRTNSGAALVHAARAGLGLIQVFEFWVRDALAAGELRCALVTHEPEPRPLSALYARARHDLPRVRAFVEFAARLLAP